MIKDNIRQTNSKELICSSFFNLLDNTNYGDISILQISDKSGVNRSTFYRNFNTKEDIVIYFFYTIMNEFISKEKNSPSKSMEDYLYKMFTMFYQHKKQLLSLYNNDLGYLMFIAFNDIFNKHLNKQNYEISYHLGGIYNFILFWLKNNMKKTPKELAKLACNMFKKDFTPYLMLHN